MWSFIEERVEKLEPSDLEKVKAANYGHVPEFAGFDGNNESELMNIAHFLDREMNRSRASKGVTSTRIVSSIARQRRMVAAFEPIRATLDLGRQPTASQIIAILRRGRA